MTLKSSMGKRGNGKNEFYLTNFFFNQFKLNLTMDDA